MTTVTLFIIGSLDIDITTDTTPKIYLSYPTNTTYYDSVYSIPKRTSINWTISDYLTSACILYNGTTNITVTCSSNGSIINVDYSNYFFNLYVNDTVGLVNQSSVYATYTYQTKQNSLTYNPVTVEGSSENFILNLTVAYWETLDSAYLVYNGTTYPSTITSVSPDTIISNTITIPSTTATSNKTFYYILNFGSSSNTTSVYNQTVRNINIDDCSSYTVVLYNMTIRDQEVQNILNGTDYNITNNVNFVISSPDLTVNVANYSKQYLTVTPNYICSDVNLTAGRLRVDATIRFEAYGRVAQFYHLQNNTLSNTTIPQTIDLYDLVNTSSTSFLITYKDENYNPVQNALVIIKRKYIQEGLFKTIEVPLTDLSGQAVGHFDTDSVIYSIYISKDGVILDSFENVVVVCDNSLIGDCKINLIPTATSGTFDDFTRKDDLYYSISLNQTTRVLKTQFATTNGLAVNMTMNATKYDAYLNDTTCYNSLTSNAGTLTCTIPDSYGNVTIVVSLYKNGQLVTTEILRINEDLNDYFSNDRIFFLLLFVITIPLMFMSSTIGMLIGLILSLVLSSLLYLYSNSSIIGKTSAIMWLIIALGVVIFKISKRMRE